jgi:hypothetical protein
MCLSRSKKTVYQAQIQEPNVKKITLMLIGLGLIGLGCRDTSPAPPRVPVPSSGNRVSYAEPERDKPVVDNWAYQQQQQQPGFADEPLVNQPPPEQRAFVDAYNRVGRPRLTVFVNRTLEGSLLPVNENEPVLSVQQSRKSTTGVTVERKEGAAYRGYYDSAHVDRSDTYKSNGPSEYKETTEVYLKPGQYDEAQAKSLDYEAVENIMADWLAASGQTVMIAPSMARQRMTDEELKDLQSGRPVALSEVAKRLGADVLIQVQAHPTRQTAQGLEVRVIAEAINTKGGQSIGRAVVDMEPPLVKTSINNYTRFLARKLMLEMSQSWGAMALAEVKPPMAPPERPIAPPAKEPTPLPGSVPNNPTPAPVAPANPVPPPPPTTQEKPVPAPTPAPSPAPGSTK